MARMTAAQLLLADGYVTAKVEVADGFTTPLNVHLKAPTLTVDALAEELTTTQQKVDKDGKLTIKCPPIQVTDNGRVKQEATASAKRTVEQVRVYLYAHVGRAAPDREELGSKAKAPANGAPVAAGK